MSEIANSIDISAFDNSEGRALEGRVLRVMMVAVALAVVVSGALAPWRVTTGVLLGGMLSLVNHHWLRTSIAAVFNVAEAGKRPHIKASRFIFRYFLIAAIVFAAYQMNVISLPATLAGLSSFVVALFAEAFRAFYFAIIHREETD